MLFDNLRGAGFAGHFPLFIGQSGLAGGAASSVDNLPESFADYLHILVIDINLYPFDIIVFNKMWREICAVIGKNHIHSGDLKWGCSQVTLTDTDGEGVARIPLVVNVFQLP